MYGKGEAVFFLSSVVQLREDASKKVTVEVGLGFELGLGSGFGLEVWVVIRVRVSIVTRG